MLADNIVNLSVLLGKRDAEVTANEIAQINDILFGDRFIEPIFCFDVGTNCCRHRAVVKQRIARNIVHRKECCSGYKPHCNHALGETLEDEAPHCLLLPFLSF